MNKPVITTQLIRLGETSVPMLDAIRFAGSLLVKSDYVKQDYIESMLRREHELSTYVGHGIAVPHGFDEDRDFVFHKGISVVQYPNGIESNGQMVYVLIGMASTSNEHLPLLQAISRVIQDEQNRDILRTTEDAETIIRMFNELS